MKIIFDLGGERCTYEGPDDDPPVLGDSLRTEGTKGHPPFRGVVTAILPIEGGYLVTCSPQQSPRRRANPRAWRS